MGRKFTVEDQEHEWLFPPTGDMVESKAHVVLSKNLLSVENIYSRKFDLKEAGFTDDEVDAHMPKAHVCGKRGEIDDFTRASQQRFMKACALWQPKGKMIFVTLTYPRTWPDPDERIRQFKKFQALMRKSCPDWGGCWKLEYQKRGAPHYHMVLETKDDLLSLRRAQAFVKIAWEASIGCVGRTEVKFPRNAKRAKYYLTKEVGKMVQANKAYRESCESEIVHKGRFWGWHKRSELAFVGAKLSVSSVIGVMIKEGIQTHIMRGLVKDKRVHFKEGVPYFVNTDKQVEPDLLPSFRVYDDGYEALEEIRHLILAEHGLDIRDYLKIIPPEKQG